MHVPQALTLTALLLLFSGCVANRPYRMRGVNGGMYERKYPGQKKPTEMIPASDDRRYRISFVEFDENGDFWDRAQLTTTPGHQKRLFTHRGCLLGSAPSALTSTPVDIQKPGACILENPAFEENLRNPQGLMFATSGRARAHAVLDHAGPARYHPRTLAYLHSGRPRDDGCHLPHYESKEPARATRDEPGMTWSSSPPALCASAL